MSGEAGSWSLGASRRGLHPAKLTSVLDDERAGAETGRISPKLGKAGRGSLVVSVGFLDLESWRNAPTVAGAYEISEQMNCSPIEQVAD